MRWILIVALAAVGCRKRAKPAEVPAPAPPAAVESVQVSPSPAAAPALAPNAPPAVKRASRAGHPGEPANPAELHGLAEKYFNQVGSFPSSWQQLIDRKYLKAVPLGKNGKPLDFRQYAEWATLSP